MHYVPGHLWTQEMCERAVEKFPRALGYVPGHFKMQEIFDKAVYQYPYLLQYVPDWFVTREWVDIWYDDYYDHWDDDDGDIFLIGIKSIKNERLKKPQ